MKDWFAQLNQREQMSLFILSLAVGLYLLLIIVWSPLETTPLPSHSIFM